MQVVLRVCVCWGGGGGGPGGGGGGGGGGALSPPWLCRAGSPLRL